MAGYSGTPLATKLGIKPGHRLALLGAPSGFADTLAPLPEPVTVATALRGTADVVVLFTKQRAELEQKLPLIIARLDPAGGCWIAWPKKASKVPTDITEDTIREVALPRGLVDNKVCAIDDVWSGLRLVIRLEHRPKSSTRRR
jgi:hypothetical protein